MAPENFAQLVERTRQATNDVCEKSKLILRRLLPGVEALQKDNAHFSPRLMLLMLSRTGDELSPNDRAHLHAALQFAEAFQLQLVSWMMAVKERPDSVGTAAEVQQCADALQVTAGHLSELDALLRKVDGTRGAR